ncbi:hydroxymethylbilane synthase [Sporolactobacillus sp. THM7-4]|nr:hydroxymethylbilane synthase [Sporolactobacillus sp. THM7-4]
MRTIYVGSRKSKLALIQSQWVIEQLTGQSADFNYEIKHIVTKGDRILNVTLSKVGGKGLFVKEIERSLLNGTIDFAVHSMKDVPAELPEGLEIASIPRREDAHDVLLSRTGARFDELPSGAIIGTSSLRRAAQLLHARPDLTVRPVRGNVDTRLAKLQAGEYDAIILAAAGIKRMGWPDSAATEYLPYSLSVPACGQGALAIECRSDDRELKSLLRKINDEKTARTVSAERVFLKRLGGSCQVPIAAFCEQDNEGRLSFSGLVASPDGTTVLRSSMTGDDPLELGRKAAEDVLARGAGKILSEFTV